MWHGLRALERREIASHLKEINRLRQAMGHDAIVIPGRAEGGGAGGAAGGAGSQGGSTRVPAGAEPTGYPPGLRGGGLCPP